jgi:hypothetical protein
MDGISERDQATSAVALEPPEEGDGLQTPTELHTVAVRNISLRAVGPMPTPHRSGVFTVMTENMRRQNARLTVQQQEDGTYQTLAGRCIADLHKLQKLLEFLQSGLVVDIVVRCVVVAPLHLQVDTFY